jgi:alanine dehydrogenase
MPGAVPRTSTFALSNATLPYVLALADRGLTGAISEDGALGQGVNTLDGHVTYQAVADAFGMDYAPLNQLL